MVLELLIPPMLFLARKLVPLTLPLGKSSWIVTTATGIYWDVLPASQANCYDAYHFTPVGVQSWTTPSTPLTGALKTIYEYLLYSTSPLARAGVKKANIFVRGQ